MKHNVRFQIEKRKDKKGLLITDKVPLFADIRFSGTRIFYFTGYRIDRDCFDSREQQAIKNTSAYQGKRKVSYSDVNRRLRLIKAALTNIFDNTKVAPAKITVVEVLDDACQKIDQAVKENKSDPLEFIPMFQTYLQNARLSAHRKQYVASIISHWQRYADVKKKTLTFDTITADTLREFERFLLTEKKLVKKDGTIKEARGMNTLHTIFAITRTFWNHARKEFKANSTIIQYPFDSFKVPAEVYGTPIYLTLDERNALFNAAIEDKRLARVRDIFVFQCMTGARVGDLCRMTRSNVNNNTLSYIPRKTKEGKPVTVTVPLSMKAIEILSRYNMPDGRLMPFITDQRYNDYLKELFKVVGLTRIVTRLHSTTREEENVRLCDIVSSHMARRSFIGNMFGKIDSAIIGSMSGHVNNSKAFARYYDVSKELQQQAIKFIE